MTATQDGSAPDVPRRHVPLSLEEAAWLHGAGQGRPEDLPMTAAEALAAGWDTPALRELAGLPRTADSRYIGEVFEQALSEAGIALPDHNLARRHLLRRLAVGFLAGEVDLAGLASDDWWETEAETAQERALMALLPYCACCIPRTPDLDQEAWERQLRSAALALASCPAIGPGA